MLETTIQENDLHIVVFPLFMSNYIAKRKTRDPLGVLRIKRATTIEDLLDAVATRDIGSFYFLVQVAGNGGG